MKKLEFYVGYSYGQGRRWGIMKAPSVAVIKKKYPFLTVSAEPPAWIRENSEVEAMLRRNHIYDIDEPARGIVEEYLALEARGKIRRHQA